MAAEIPNCHFCGNSQEKPGALIFSPPSTLLGFQVVRKFHICVLCFDGMMEDAMLADRENGMNDAMRERAVVLVDGFLGLKADGYRKDCSSITDAVVDFAASEADRRERECIEAVCERCRVGPPIRKVTEDGCEYLGWEHSKDQWEWYWCHSERIHELRYQRQQREKGEGNAD